MANNLDSNITRKVLRSFLKGFESNRVLTKAVDTQLFSGRFNPSTGSTIDVKRPHDYNTIRTADGNISAATKSSIIAGKASAIVQDRFTVAMDWQVLEEAIQLDQLDMILEPAASRLVTDLELAFAQFMIQNSGLSYGSPDIPVSKWSDVAGAGALMKAIGVPQDGMWNYVVNPFTQTALAGTQTGLTSADQLVRTAWEQSAISKDFAGLRVFTSNALESFTSGTSTDRVGALAANPDGTYLTHKDSMVQTWSVSGFTASATIKAGEIVEVTGRNQLSLATRKPLVDETGAQVKFRAVVVQDATMDGTGAGTLLVTGPAINEPNGQYNTVDTPLQAGDVITVLGTASKVYQPNLFFHKQAFGVAFVKLPKLHSTDTVAMTKDGISIRVSRYSDGDADKQTVRFDLQPAFGVFNPFFAGLGYGK